MGSSIAAQTPRAKASLDDLKFLLGDWEAVGGGGPGAGAGGFSFVFDLQKKILVRRSYAEYPATAVRSAVRHDDLMVVYVDDSANDIIANFYDSEGHQIKYNVTPAADGQSVTFLSDTVAAQPRYRLTYILQKDGTLSGSFEIAPPGQPEAFKNYLRWTGKKR